MSNKKKKKLFKVLSIIFIFAGVLIISYIFFPFISWQIYFAPQFNQQNIAIPIPKYTVVSNFEVSNLIKNATNTVGVDYSNASNWFPNYKFQKSATNKNYTISIPKIQVENAVVATSDTDVSKHLVNYIGTSLPPQKGNAVIFGHSSLPQLYDPKNYKTIFTYLYKLTPEDEIFVVFNGVKYKYKVENITVVDPDNTTVLEQNYDDSFITLVTCTPPGTIWKRLVVKAKLQNI